MRKDMRFFIIIVIFQMVVLLGFLIFMNHNHSVLFRKTAASKAINEDVVNEATQNDTVIGNMNDYVEEELVTAEELEDVEDIEEPEPEETKLLDVEYVDEPVSDNSVSEDAVVSENEAPEENNERKFYALVTHTVEQDLLLRAAPSLSANVINRISTGTAGYVLDYGDEYCRIVITKNPKLHGYAATEFLELTEVAREEIPEDLQALIDDPDSVPKEMVKSSSTPALTAEQQAALIAYAAQQQQAAQAAQAAQ
ncbi:MAG: hypothetical protein K6F99_04140 [Lachnospiraceae bacterium]|nr:hypothetical protein [Lachnospiraceae bacterium]